MAGQIVLALQTLQQLESHSIHVTASPTNQNQSKNEAPPG